MDFNPRAPRGARPEKLEAADNGESYFNPRAPRGARRFPFVTLIDSIFISIHVPREGHDLIDSIFEGKCQ